MKPKPFWPLNHLTVPVGIFFSKSTSRATITRFHSTGRCLWERARWHIQKGTAANRILEKYGFLQQNARNRRNPYEIRKTIQPSRRPNPAARYLRNEVCLLSETLRRARRGGPSVGGPSGSAGSIDLDKQSASRAADRACDAS